MKILLVEDDEVDRMAFERYVLRAGLEYDYDIAASVGEAKRLLSEKEYDVGRRHGL
jgi:CheY-like chemotaxis protein